MKSGRIENDDKQLRRELMIRIWVRRRRGPVGKRMLGDIQAALGRQFGADTAESPAAIARVLADEGAELRHPEIIEFDSQWRRTKHKAEEERVKGLDDLLIGRALSLTLGEALLRRLEALRLAADSATGSRELRDIAIRARQRLESLSRDQGLDSAQRAEQSEIVEWLKVWIQTPGLFQDWLDLRRRSADFRRKFPGSGESV